MPPSSAKPKSSKAETHQSIKMEVEALDQEDTRPLSHIKTKEQIRREKTLAEVLYRITFRGRYLDRKQESQEFEIDLYMKDKHVAQNPLTMLKDNAKEILRSKYSDFAQFLKFWVHAAVVVDDQTREPNGEPVQNPKIMSRSELVSYCADNELDIYFQLYKTDDELRTAIDECEREPKAFYYHQEKLWQKRAGKIEVGHDIQELNQPSKKVEASQEQKSKQRRAIARAGNALEEKKAALAAAQAEAARLSKELAAAETNALLDLDPLAGI